MALTTSLHCLPEELPLLLFFFTFLRIFIKQHSILYNDSNIYIYSLELNTTVKLLGAGNGNSSGIILKSIFFFFLEERTTHLSGWKRKVISC